MSAQGFAVAARRHADGWHCELIRDAALADLGSCLAALGPTIEGDEVVALISAADHYFVAIRLGAQRPRFLLSDATAAFDSALARQVLTRVPAFPTADVRRRWPAGHLGLFTDLGVPAARLRSLLANDELSPDELFGYLAERLGFGAQYDAVVDALPGTPAG